MSKLRAHKLLHLPSQRNQLRTVCNKTFKDSADLKAHKLEHSLPEHKCSTCGGKFIGDAAFNAHMLLHDDGKTFPCGVCGEMFYSLAEWQGHLPTHIVSFQP